MVIMTTAGRSVLQLSWIGTEYVILTARIGTCQFKSIAVTVKGVSWGRLGDLWERQGVI